MTVSHSLTLVVLNSEQLDINSQVQHQFDYNGGTLGASEKDHWQLRDRLGAVLPEHARIEMCDGHFSLCDLSGQSFINASLSPIGRGRNVLSSHGDELVIGPFSLGVYLNDLMQEQNIDQLLGQDTASGLDGWLGDVTKRQTKTDALRDDVTNDPLWVLQQEQHQSLLNAHGDHVEAVLSTALTAFSAAEDTMDQKFMELPDINNPLVTHDASGSLDSHLLAPLMRGLGQTLTLEDAKQQREMLEEMGKSLRAMVEGLLVL